jgi:hypothetical protein
MEEGLKSGSVFTKNNCETLMFIFWGGKGDVMVDHGQSSANRTKPGPSFQL